MSRLLVKIPTRNRPDRFRNLINQLLQHLSGENEVRFVISLDHDDATMNNEAIVEYLQNLQNEVDLSYFFGDSRTKIEAVNADLEGEEADVIIVISDDMIPKKQNFDNIIFREFSYAFSDFDGAIKFSDGLRNDDLMTIPVLGWPLYKRFGYIYQPRYKSAFCDEEQTLVCSLLGKIISVPICILRHDWICGDALSLRNQQDALIQEDYLTFRERQLSGFGLAQH